MVNGVTGSSGQASATTGNRFAELSTEEFMKVLFTELQNQDPLKPQDSSKMLEQLSSLRNIESQLTLQEDLKALVTQNQVASAGNLIGKLVQGLDEGNNQIIGLVTGVRVQGDDVLLQLDSGQQLNMGRLTAIAEMPPETAAATEDAGA